MNRIYNYIEKDLIKKGDYILNFPYKCKLSGYVFINIFNLITLSDILHAYTNSLYSYIKLISNVGVNGALYSITSFKYFILYYALKSLPDNTEIVFSNQKDRWALLFSNFENLRKTLIQHGTTFSRGFPPVYLKDYVIYNPEDNLYYQNIPYRLNEINTLYAFSQLEAKYMMLSEHEKKCLQLKIIGYNMTCFNKFINNKSSVLIVGHYYQYCNEEKFLLNFFKNISIHVFLKTHPQVGKKPYRSLMKKYNFDLIEGKCFPKVDFLISYNSTLAYEYEAIRVPVIYYDEIRLADNELDAKSLKNKINSILTKKPGNNLD